MLSVRSWTASRGTPADVACLFFGHGEPALRIEEFCEELPQHFFRRF